MSFDEKKYYDQALEEVKVALEALEKAEKCFTASSHSVDDFVSTRHEVMERAVSVAEIKRKLQLFYAHADATKFK